MATRHMATSIGQITNCTLDGFGKWTPSSNTTTTQPLFSRDTMGITGHAWGHKPGHLSGLTVCARNTFDAPQGRGERCTRARPPWAELQANPHDWARHVRDQGPRQLPDQQLPYHPWHMAQPAGLGWEGRNPAEHHCLLGNQPLTRSFFYSGEKPCVSCYTIPLHDFHVSFSFSLDGVSILQSILSLVYPPFLSNTLSIPVGRFGYVFFFYSGHGAVHPS